MLSLSIKASLGFAIYFRPLACIALNTTSGACHGRSSHAKSCSSAVAVPAAMLLQKRIYDSSELMEPVATVPPTPSPSKPKLGDSVFVLNTTGTRGTCPHLISATVSVTVTMYDPQEFLPYKIEGCPYSFGESDLEKRLWAVGSPDCPCIDLLAHDLVQGGLQFINAPTGMTSVPSSYGSYCEAWDTADGLEYQTECLPNATAPPSWCTLPWCYVDLDNCAKKDGGVSQYFEFVNPPLRVGFSWETCQIPCDISCESAGLSAAVCAERSVLCGSDCEEFTNGICDEDQTCFGWRGDTECAFNLRENRTMCRCKNHPDECAMRPMGSSSSIPFLNATICAKGRGSKRLNSTGGMVGALVKDLSLPSSSLM